MKKISLVVVLFCFIISYTFSSCKKINEATELGGDLIPPVDNVHTFDTTLSVETSNFLFSELEDTTSSGVLQFLGNINNDPLFGKTEGRMYFQVAPAAIKTPFPFKKEDLVGLDSVVLVLGYNNLFGDSVQPQQVAVYEIPTSQDFKPTTDYKINKEPFSLLGPSLSPVKTFSPQHLNDTLPLIDEKVANQLRIPLNNFFGMRLLDYDTTNAYASDSAFKKHFNGFAVVPQNNGSANALIGINLLTTKLSFYVRYKKGDKIDTTTVHFGLNNNSAIANYIKRDYSGAEIANAVQGPEPDEQIYIQSAPGSYATIKIPALPALDNRVVHLAELTIEQIHDPLASIFSPPGFLYVDAYDAEKQRYRTVPFDVALAPSGTNPTGDTASYDISNAAAFGMIGRTAVDGLGNSIFQWKFNLSRYVQHVVNDTEPSQELRLYSPFPTIRANSSGVEQFINSGQAYAIGRVRVGGGNHPTQRMKLRIVYSKL